MICICDKHWAMMSIHKYGQRVSSHYNLLDKLLNKTPILSVRFPSAWIPLLMICLVDQSFLDSCVQLLLLLSHYLRNVKVGLSTKRVLLLSHDKRPFLYLFFLALCLLQIESLFYWDRRKLNYDKNAIILSRPLIE